MKHNGTIEILKTSVRPASKAQQRVWRLDRLRPQDPALHIAAMFELTGDLNHSALEGALNELVRRHDVLRANFEVREERLVRVIADERRIDLPVCDTEAEAEATAREPFNLESGSLVRARLLKSEPTRNVLVLTFHRMVCDERTVGGLTDELGVLYEAFATGSAVVDSRMAGRAAEDLEFEEFEGEGFPRFELTPDFSRTRADNPEGRILSRKMPQATIDGLEPLGGRSGFVAVLIALLARYTGESDIVLGIDRKSLVRVNAAGDSTFPELQALTEQALSGPGRQSGLLPSINFVQDLEPLRGWTRAGLRLEPLPPCSPGALYDLNFRLTDHTISCEYNRDLYRSETIDALLEHYELLCADIVKNPAGKLAEFSFLTPAEEQKLLVEWNSTQFDYPRELCIHHLFEQSAARTPDAIAIEFEKKTLTFAELDARANRLARYLSDRGSGPGALVGIFLDRSFEMVAAVLAVLKTGAAYLPLDPAFPTSRLEFMAADADIRVLVTSEALERNLNTTATTVLVDAKELAIRRTQPSPLCREIDGESPAYVLYTSGSTGQPKGVEVRHRSVVNLLHTMQTHVQLEAAGSLLALTTLSFDIAVLELFLPLMTGSRLVLASREQATDPRMLRELLTESKPSLMQATPGTWRMLADAGWKGSPELKILVGGEKVSRETADLLLERGQAVWNCYGPTETTVWSTICRLEKDAQPVSIGRPLGNTTLYVLDANRRLLPIGAAGELYIGGEGVARGYLRRPELTAERFIATSFGAGRLYKTGDIVRYGHDGRLEILGRNDAQVKIRGFRIELGDVEAALSACPGVKSAAAVVRVDDAGESVLAGYFVADGAVRVADVRRSMTSRLPAYMVPTFLVPMKEFPFTSNGKIDRKALPAPQSTIVEKKPMSVVSMPSVDALETTLIEIWESILGVRPIRPSDNFFDLGGQSVMAARIFVRMESVLGKALPLATLFQAPTVEKLAEVIRRSEWKPMWSSLVPIRPEGSRPPFFFVHPIGGNVLNFSGFCGHFGPDQPIYGLQARGLDGEVMPHTSVEEMAADYIENIRSVQPEGPYYIGGFSAGGVVAFEMARQLQAVAQPVDILALLDTEILTLVQEKVSVAARLNHWWRMVKVNFRYASRMSAGDYLGKKSFNLRMRRKLFAWGVKERLGLAIDPSTLNVEEAFLLAFKRYVPQPFYGDATLFRAGDGAEYLDPKLGWGDIIRGRLDIQEVSGDHDTILQEPHIGMLAGLLENCLEQANRNEIHRPALTMAAAAGEGMAGLTPAIDLGKS
jgi:amino acid adenylation domain-containing protein